MALLEITDLKKTYRTPDNKIHTVLDVPHFSMDYKSQVGLCGESGTGKTTFLHLIAGILTADEGKTLMEGRDLQSMKESERDRIRANHIGYIFQTFNLLQGYTCLENVLLGMSFGPGSDREYATELLQRVGMGDRLQHYPRQLSTGQQQRVAVARALANRPKLVLADEPTGNLDSKHAITALRLIRDVCKANDAALLLVSHDRQILDTFDPCWDLASINKVTTEDNQ
ncbi:MAG: ABC transporter ATP-binding protein [Verrucomicrobia bacterium]|jgi:ABC-type lipoprotein export system ATPase subunit|nr:ABC transporter ATP-binding protein [Verrucomicrobiota bacterium]